MTREEYREQVLAAKDRLHTYATWMLRNREDARDVAQEALLRLWTHRTVVPPGAARTWLLRTAHRLCVDRLRRRNGHGEVLLDPDAMVRPLGGSDPSAAIRLGEVRTGVAEGLAALPDRDRALLVLREMQGMSYQEIAEVIGRPVGTVKVALHRARGRLREVLREVMERV